MQELEFLILRCAWYKGMSVFTRNTHNRKILKIGMPIIIIFVTVLIYEKFVFQCRYGTKIHR